MGIPRIVNFRTFLFSAVAAILAVIFFVEYYRNAALALIGFCALGIMALILCVIYRKDEIKLIGMAVVVCIALVTVVNCIMTMSFYKSNALFTGDSAKDFAVNGTIEEIYDDGLSKSLLVRPSDQDESGNIIVYLQESYSDEIDCSQFEIGDRFYCTATLSKLSLIDDDGINGYYYRLGVKYRCYVESGEFSVQKRVSVPYDCYIREQIRSGFISVLGRRYGEIAYGMTVGDKSQLEYGTRSAYSISGIGHILAVSGLHIMFLSWIIARFCKILRLGRKSSFFVNAIILFLYNVLVGFSASVVRAAVMSLCAQVAGVTGERNDSLNNLGLACSLYLMIRPFAVFDAGFVMSVVAVLGINIFYKPLSGALGKLCRGKLTKVTNAVALSLSAQIGITPAMLYYFSQLSIYSVMANVVLSYVIMLTFIVLFIAMIISLVLPFMWFTAALAYPGLYIFDVVTRVVSSLPFADFALFAGGAVFSVYAAYFVMSRYVMKGRFKWPAVALCLTYMLVMIAGYNFTFEDTTSRVYCYPDEYGQTVSVLIDGNGNTALVADLTGRENLFDRIMALKMPKIDEVVLMDCDFSIARELALLSDKIQIGKVYVREFNANALEVFDNAGITTVVLAEGEETDMGFRYVNLDKFCAVEYTLYEKILFVSSGVDAEDIESPAFSTYTLFRMEKGQKVDGKKVLGNQLFNLSGTDDGSTDVAGVYFYDLKRDKIEIFN